MDNNLYDPLSFSYVVSSSLTRFLLFVLTQFSSEVVKSLFSLERFNLFSSLFTHIVQVSFSRIVCRIDI